MKYKYNPLTKMLEPIRTKDAKVNGEEAEWRTLKGHHVAVGENGEIVAGGIPNTNIGANHNTKVDASKSPDKSGKKGGKSWSKLSQEDRDKRRREIRSEAYLSKPNDPKIAKNINKAVEAYKNIKDKVKKKEKITEKEFDEWKENSNYIDYADFGGYKKRDSWMKKNLGRSRLDEKLDFILNRANTLNDIEEAEAAWDRSYAYGSEQGKNKVLF